MTTTRVMIGIPKDAKLKISKKDYTDLYQTGGGDEDFIQNGKSLAEKSNFKFYVFTAHVVEKEAFVKILQQTYPKFFYVQMTE